MLLLCRVVGVLLYDSAGLDAAGAGGVTNVPPMLLLLSSSLEVSQFASVVASPSSAQRWGSGLIS